ncbi:hypothetical protein C8R44DRAFT_869861 [Mycena epipterygia]|nr:hypothetical protein C8R44DRAFT_869861 [Mycena epipterygia]
MPDLRKNKAVSEEYEVEKLVGKKPEDIPFEALDYKDSPKLPDLVAKDGRHMEMDPESVPVYFNPEVHYRAFAPTHALPKGVLIDEINWVFSQDAADLTITDLDNVNSRGSHRNYVISGEWGLDLIRLGDRLYKVCKIIVNNCPFY